VKHYGRIRIGTQGTSDCQGRLRTSNLVGATSGLRLDRPLAADQWTSHQSSDDQQMGIHPAHLGRIGFGDCARLVCKPQHVGGGIACLRLRFLAIAIISPGHWPVSEGCAAAIGAAH
jgi:hypothetical protein